MKLREHPRPVARGIRVGEVRPHGRLWVPHEADEGGAVGVLEEDVHLKAEVEGRVGARGLAARDAGVHDRDVVHAVLCGRGEFERKVEK